jgi:hypothetical protein
MVGMARKKPKDMTDRELLELVEQRSYHIEEKLDKLLEQMERVSGMIP